MVFRLRRANREKKVLETSSVDGAGDSTSLKSSLTRHSEGSCGSWSAGTMTSQCEPSSCERNRTRQDSSQSQSSRSTRSGNSKHSSSASSDHQSHSSARSGISAESSCNTHTKGSRKSASRCSTSSGSKTRKSVSFSVLEIRDYERILGDNPSCSSGPAIGIGWSHGETQVIAVQVYERKRPAYRKKQLEMALTREEREKLLYSWGVTSHEIANGVRSVLKAKNQRRQTIRNLNKAPIEEGLQSATRKLKRALLFRPRTGEEAKRLEELAKLANPSLRSATYDGQDSQLVELSDGMVVTESSDDALENLKVQVGHPDVSATEWADSNVRTESSTVYEDDLASHISGLSFGESATASVLEIEKFYRDLELEMFGTEELPSMVGQTLEVVGVDIPEDDRVYDDPPSVSGFQEPPSVTIISEPPEESIPAFQAGGPTGASGFRQPPVTSLNQLLRAHDRYSQGVNRPGYPPSVPCQEFFTQSSGIGIAGSTSNYVTVEGMTGNSLDSHPMGRMPQQVRSCDDTFIVPSAGLQQSYPRGMYTGITYSSYAMKKKTARDAPRVLHTPPPTHLSPTNWMEDTQTCNIQRRYDPVTISEDDLTTEGSSSVESNREQGSTMRRSYDPRLPLPFSMPTSYY